jgi:hypothetical protein
MPLARLYPRWILTNALAELLGLGGTFALIALVTPRLGAETSAAVVLAAFATAVFAGVLEATVVGLSQHWAMRPWFPQVSRLHWWLGTLAGALLAYVLGYLPSTLMSLSAVADPAAAPVQEPPQLVVLLLAAALGAVGGAVLSFAQYLAMRKRVKFARRWIPANMLAWTLGMPIIFQGMDLAFRVSGTAAQVAVIALALLLAGTVVGAVHGRALVRMAATE